MILYNCVKDYWTYVNSMYLQTSNFFSIKTLRIFFIIIKISILAGLWLFMLPNYPIRPVSPLNNRWPLCVCMRSRYLVQPPVKSTSLTNRHDYHRSPMQNDKMRPKISYLVYLEPTYVLDIALCLYLCYNNSRVVVLDDVLKKPL